MQASTSGPVKEPAGETALYCRSAIGSASRFALRRRVRFAQARAVGAADGLRTLPALPGRTQPKSLCARQHVTREHDACMGPADGEEFSTFWTECDAEGPDTRHGSGQVARPG